MLGMGLLSLHELGEFGLGWLLMLELVQMTLIVVTLSILLHGISVKPLLARFSRRNPPRLTA